MRHFRHLHLRPWVFEPRVHCGWLEAAALPALRSLGTVATAALLRFSVQPCRCPPPRAWSGFAQIQGPCRLPDPSVRSSVLPGTWPLTPCGLRFPSSAPRPSAQTWASSPLLLSFAVVFNLLSGKNRGCCNLWDQHHIVRCLMSKNVFICILPNFLFVQWRKIF